MNAWMVMMMLAAGAVSDEPKLEEDRLCEVESKVFDQVMYSSSSKKLTLIFDNGRVYEYYQVPKKHWQGIMSSPRKGHYFNKQIRSKYKYRRIG